jgi:hypothetical protein
MAANVLIDVAIGAIPFLGDLFDVAFKANTRNIKLLEPYRHRAEIAAERPGMALPPVIDPRPVSIPWRLVVPIAVVLFGVLALVLIGFITVIRWLFQF